jgi:hypothetical protein
MTSTGGSKRGEMDTDHAWALPEKDSEEDEQPVLLLLLAPATLKPFSSITNMALEPRKNAEHHTGVGAEREHLDDGRCAGGDRERKGELGHRRLIGEISHIKVWPYERGQMGWESAKD